MSNEDELQQAVKHYLNDVEQVMARMEAVCFSLREGACLGLDAGCVIDDNIKFFVETCEKEARTMEKFGRSMSIGAKLMLGFIEKGNCNGSHRAD